MDSSKARYLRKETYTHKNMDPKISTIGIMYMHQNNIHNSPKINSKSRPNIWKAAAKTKIVSCLLSKPAQNDAQTAANTISKSCPNSKS